MIEVPFEELEGVDLIVDALYKGGSAGNVSDDPISHLLPVGNQAGFRYYGGATTGLPQICVLYSSLDHPDWPDSLNHEDRKFLYYGDNKTLGNKLLDTPRKGNLILMRTFSRLRRRDKKGIPPFFVFTKAKVGRDVHFRGIAVPGHIDCDEREELVIIERTSESGIFQNYRATFAILPDLVIRRRWILDLESGQPYSDSAPTGWLGWMSS